MVCARVRESAKWWNLEIVQLFAQKSLSSKTQTIFCNFHNFLSFCPLAARMRQPFKNQVSSNDFGGSWAPLGSFSQNPTFYMKTMKSVKTLFCCWDSLFSQKSCFLRKPPNRKNTNIPQGILMVLRACFHGNLGFHKSSGIPLNFTDFPDIL